MLFRSDRMIRRLRVGRELPQCLLRVHGGLVDHLAEMLVADVVRTAERREQPFVIEQLERAQVDLLVAAQRVLELALVPREGRRIEDDVIPRRPGDLRDLHNSPHSFPTRRSSDRRFGIGVDVDLANRTAFIDRPAEDRKSTRLNSSH